MEVPRERRAVVVGSFIGSCVMALAITVLAMRSLNLAIAGWGGAIGLTVLLIEPFIGLINYLAFLYIRPQDFVPSMQGMPIMLILGAGTAALAFLHQAFSKQTLVLARVPQHIFVLWVFVAVGASRLAMGHVRGAVEAILDFLPTVVMYFLLIELTTTPKKIRIVFITILHLTLVLAVQGIVQYYTGGGLGGMEAYKDSTEETGGRIQAVGIFADPNDLALVINTVLPLTLILIAQSRSGLVRLYSILIAAVFIFAIFLTESRGGLLAMGAMAILFFYRKFGKIVGIPVGLMVMGALLVLGPRMNTISTEEASSYGRLEAWSLAMDLFKGSPLFGIGYNHFMDYHFRTAHNSYLLCTAELGLFGLYPWLMLFYISYKNTVFVEKELVRRGQREFAMYVYAAHLSLVVFFLGALLLSRTYHPLLFIMIGLCTCIARVFVAQSEERYALIERRDFVMGFLLTIGSLIVWEIFLRLLW
jgi:putative inorganic carbon (HCO3(-)) transporter